MGCGGPGRGSWGWKEGESNHSHEWEGSQESGIDSMRKHGRTPGENLRLSHLIKADKVWLEVAVQRMLDIWLRAICGQLRFLESYLFYCTETFSSCIPHRLPLCSFLKPSKLGPSFLPQESFSSIWRQLWCSVLVFSILNNRSFSSFQSLCGLFLVMLLE